MHTSDVCIIVSVIFLVFVQAVQLLPDSMRVAELRLFLQSWAREFATERHKRLLQRGVAKAVAEQVSIGPMFCLFVYSQVSLNYLFQVRYIK